MELHVSLKEILMTLESENVELTENEINTINSVFSEVDKWDENGETCANGDKILNPKEYYLFTKLIKGVESLFEKISNIELFSFCNSITALDILFAQGELDDDFLKNLSEDEVNELVANSFNIRRDTYVSLDSGKIAQLFQMQLQILKNNGCYTEDLEILINDLLANLSKPINQHTEIFNSLRTHISRRLIVAKENQNVDIKEPNGEIDVNFEQGRTGDCWLLSAIKALTCNETFLEKLNNMISVQKDGDELVSVTVHLQGKDYVISSEELHSAIEYSTGDLDVRALEIAVNRFCLENGYKDITAGNNVEAGYAIFGGDADKIKEAYESSKSLVSNLIDCSFVTELKNGNRLGVLGGAHDDKYVTDVETGETVKLLTDHAYTIIDSDPEFVYITNPHDPSKKLKLKIDDVINTFGRGYLYDIQ